MESLSYRRFAAPERILVATDLTDGDFLIPHVVAQAKASNAHVTLIHSILPIESFSIDAGAIPHTDPNQLESEVHTMLLGMASRIECHGIPCEAVVRNGFAAEEIEAEIRATGATRLIMATHGRGKWGQLMLGSVTNQLLGTVKIPIFAVGPHCQKAANHAIPRKILHPVSMTGAYRTAVKLAIELARTFGAELTLLHIPDRDIEHSIHPGCTLSWAENLATQLIPETEKFEGPLHISVAFGNKADEIRKEAANMGADWIVVGVDEAFASWPLAGSTAYKVLASTECPVFAIPAQLELLNRQKAVQKPAMAFIGS